MTGKRTYTSKDPKTSNFSHKIARSVHKGFKDVLFHDLDEEVLAQEYLTYLIMKDLQERGFEGDDPDQYLEMCKEKRK